MSILARWTTTCPRCQKPIRERIDWMAKYHGKWMHDTCKQKAVAALTGDVPVIQLPESRGAADRPPTVASNDRIQQRRRRRGGMS